MPSLIPADRELLEFARLSWTYEGEQINAIRARFDMSRDSYWLRVNRLIDTEAALAFDPFTCRRLQRLRDSRRVGARRA